MKTFRRHSVILAICLIALGVTAAGSAFAITANDSSDLDEKQLARSVELDGLVFPVFEGRLLENYLFISARVTVAPGRDTWNYREKAHLIRDALILAAHEESLHVKDDIHSLDYERAEKKCLEAANKAVGEDGALIEMIFIKVASKRGFNQ